MEPIHRQRDGGRSSGLLQRPHARTQVDEPSPLSSDPALSVTYLGGRQGDRAGFAPGVKIYSVAARLFDGGLLVLAGAAGWMSVGTSVALLPSSMFGALTWIVPVVTLWMLLLELAGAYAVGRITDIVHDLRGVVRTSVALGAGVAIFAYAINWELSRRLVAVTFGLGLVFLLLSHLFIRRSIQRAHLEGFYLRRVVAIGSRHAVSDLTDALRRAPWSGLEIVAACVPDAEAGEPLGRVGVVTTTTRLAEVVRATDAEYVFLLHGAGESSRDLRRIAWSLEGTGTRLAVVPQLTDIAHGRIRPRPVAGLPLIELEQPQLSGPETVLKRLVDVVGAAAALVVFSPVIALIALLIKREDKGPVFYRQVRVGADGQQFGCYKFRSMAVDAEQRLPQLQDENDATGVLFKMHDDPRVTKIGRFIRRHSIDELPQLVNVLKGEMSLVGPRPPLPEEVDKYEKDLGRRLRVRPGMTGLWQVSGRSELDAEESERLDLYYVDNWSIMQDLLILWRTLRVVVNGQGAY